MGMTKKQNDSILGDFNVAYKYGFQALAPKGAITTHQKAFFLIWVLTTLYWLYRLLSQRFSTKKEYNQDEKESEEVISEKPVLIDVVLQSGSPATKTTAKHTTPNQTRSDNAIKLNTALSSIVILGCVMQYYFMCDYIHYFPKADRTYNRDLFSFLSVLLFVVAVFFTTSERSDEKLLSRDQTEEWKGWMQVMFVWYHYFKAAETYNAVRVYIAAYVWMTGFGNFSFFWVRSDYSLRRMLKVLFRLNFLVLLTTIVVDNTYMLYYICVMHTFWYFTVYAMMRPFHKLNEKRNVMLLKFVIYFAVVTVVYEVPWLTKLVFSPFSFILNYEGSLHEWIFRSGLDRYATLVGMICAYNHPNAETALKYINGHRLGKCITAFVAFILLLICCFWYKDVFILAKYDYNKIHPYTSAIPLLAFIYLRNCTPWLRRRHVCLFTFLGKITLETYISQLHIYLQSNAKAIIVYVPGYPLMNFLINTIIYLYMARLLFKATITLNDYLFPTSYKQMLFNLSTVGGIILSAYLVTLKLKII